MKKIFVLALVLRLICLYLFKNVTNYDLQSYLQVGELTLKGINIYPEIANLRHPYLPFYLYFEAFAVWLGNTNMITIIILKFINIFFDLGILYLTYLLSKKDLKTALIYAVNPVTILITTLHGQFDVIPIFFLLLAIYFLNKKNDFVSVIFFSVAILIKTWPVLFIVPILRKIKNKKLAILILFFPALFIFIYLWLFKGTLLSIFKTLFYYQGLWGIWGIWTWLGKTEVFMQKISTYLFLISFFGYSWFNRSNDIIKNILRSLLFFFVFTTNFSIQYFVWLIPFLVLVKLKWFFSIIILITVYLFSFYYVWLFCINCKIIPDRVIVLQNIIGLILWFRLLKVANL